MSDEELFIIDDPIRDRLELSASAAAQQAAWYQLYLNRFKEGHAISQRVPTGTSYTQAAHEADEPVPPIYRCTECGLIFHAGIQSVECPHEADMRFP